MPMYHRQISHFIDCILDDRDPVPGPQEGLIAMKIIEAAYQAAHNGNTQEIR
jgi:predicted dehydrogenase